MGCGKEQRHRACAQMNNVTLHGRSVSVCASACARVAARTLRVDTTSTSPMNLPVSTRLRASHRITSSGCLCDTVIHKSYKSYRRASFLFLVRMKQQTLDSMQPATAPALKPPHALPHRRRRRQRRENDLRSDTHNRRTTATNSTIYTSTTTMPSTLPRELQTVRYYYNIALKQAHMPHNGKDMENSCWKEVKRKWLDAYTVCLECLILDINSMCVVQ